MNTILTSIAKTVLSCPSANPDKLYFVGGVIRDLLIAGPQYEVDDIDILIDGESEPLISECAQRLNGLITKHDKFLTAKINIDALSLDFVRARQETYERPGALPSVQPGTIDTDIARRDFTVNALALPLSAALKSGEIIPSDILDLSGGLPDLHNKTLRVFHDKSFIDDPTRIFRAARYGGRYNFSLAPHTLDLLADAIQKGALQTISKTRIFHELEKIAKEGALSSIGKRLTEWKVSPLPFIPWREFEVLKASFRESLKSNLMYDVFFSGILHASEDGQKFLKEAGVSKKIIARWSDLIDKALLAREFQHAPIESIFLASMINPNSPWRDELERRNVS